MGAIMGAAVVEVEESTSIDYLTKPSSTSEPNPSPCPADDTGAELGGPPTKPPSGEPLKCPDNATATYFTHPLGCLLVQQVAGGVRRQKILPPLPKSSSARVPP